MDILKVILHEQNKELLTRIAEDQYVDPEDKQEFINKYHKLNFTNLTIMKRDNTPKYIKKIIRCVK